MWLSKRQRVQNGSVAEVGTTTINNSALTEATATMQSRNYSSFAPYGYSFCAPVGESVLLLNGTGGTCCAGVEMQRREIEQGEIEIKSLGGAKIRLCNDGSVVINGVIITADGEIISIDGSYII